MYYGILASLKGAFFILCLLVYVDLFHQSSVYWYLQVHGSSNAHLRTLLVNSINEKKSNFMTMRIDFYLCNAMLAA